MHTPRQAARDWNWHAKPAASELSSLLDPLASCHRAPDPASARGPQAPAVGSRCHCPAGIYRVQNWEAIISRLPSTCLHSPWNFLQMGNAGLSLGLNRGGSPAEELCVRLRKSPGISPPNVCGPSCALWPELHGRRPWWESQPHGGVTRVCVHCLLGQAMSVPVP